MESCWTDCSDDISKGRLEGSSSNKEAIHITQLNKLTAVGLSNWSSVDDSDSVCYIFWNVGPEPSSDKGMSFLGLLWRGNFSSSDSPDWLVSDNDFAPVSYLVLNSWELSLEDLISLLCLSLIELLSNAEDNVESLVEGVLKLLGQELVSLSVESSAFTVT